MPSITFDLETITPLFLAGANQKTAELRPPPFRGALRYWFRAIVAVNYWNNPEELKRVESALFGDTNGSSSIIFRLSRLPNNLQLNPVTLDQNRTPGLHYLWFSTQEPISNPARQAIGADDSLSFSLKLTTRPRPHNSEQQQKDLLIAINCFWLAVNLGGFGSRERRGAGSLRVRAIHSEGIDESKLPKFTIKFRPEHIYRYLRTTTQQVINNCYRLLQLNSQNFTKLPPSPSLEVFSPSTTEIYLLNTPYPSWEAALESIGKRYREYRNDLELEDRAVLGLPLTNFDTRSRHPSPLRIKIIRSVNDYYCLLLKMSSDFPTNSRIKNPQNPSYQNIDKFIQGFITTQLQQVY